MNSFWSWLRRVFSVWSETTPETETRVCPNGCTLDVKDVGVIPSPLIRTKPGEASIPFYYCPKCSYQGSVDPVDYFFCALAQGAPGSTVYLHGTIWTTHDPRTKEGMALIVRSIGEMMTPPRAEGELTLIAFNRL